MKNRNRAGFIRHRSSPRAFRNIARSAAVLLCLLAFGVILAHWYGRILMVPAAVSAQGTKA